MSDSRSDAVVVGAGIVGAATARELARRGSTVTLVEAERPAWGASGRNPGFVWLHTRAAGLQMELGLAGRRLYDELVEELDDFEFRACGGMTYFFEDQADLFSSFVRERREAGLPMELLDGAAARIACPILPERVAGAAFNPLDAHINTERLVSAFVAAAERTGAKLVRARAQALDVAGGRCHGVITDVGHIGGDVTVLAGGVWTNSLLAPLGIRLPIESMRLQIAETEPAGLRFDPILYGPTAIKQYAFARALSGFDEARLTHPIELLLPGVELLELVAQRRDGRLLLGCPMDFPGLEDRTTVAGLGLALAVIADHLPALRDLPVARSWAGLLPETPDALPIVGIPPGLSGVIVATGHVFGNLAGPITGRLVAQLVHAEKPIFDPAPLRPDRPALTEAAVAGHGRW
jgi:glycine/D-amino acid oxidase-like deaminating enzyme